MKHILALLIAGAAASAVGAANLAGHKLLVTSVRTGDTEVFIADPTTGDMFNVSRSPSRASWKPK